MRHPAPFVVAGLLLAAVPARAAVMIEVPLEQLASTADAVVRGVVVKTGARVVMEGGVLQPRTHTWVRVDRWIAGAGPVSAVEVREPGGSYDGTDVTVSGTPHYEVGEEVLLFLLRDGPGAFRTLQMVQGKYQVTLDKRTGKRMALRDLADVAFARWRKGRMDVVPALPDPSIEVGALEARVRAVRP